MGWVRRLLGLVEPAGEGNDPTASALPPAAPATMQSDRLPIKRHGGHIVSVPAIDFMGQYAESPNGRFVLLWQDQVMINGTLRGGRYVLLDDARIVTDQPMVRPQHGKVADNGTCILNDWEGSDTLSGTFRAFAADGGEIVSCRYSANLLNNGLSPDGRLAVCQTCNAPGSPDSSVLCVFDLVEGGEIARWQPESGWANDYEFPGGDRVRMIRHAGVPLDYGLDGEFLDRRVWYADEVARGTNHVIASALKHGEPVTGLALDDLRAGATVAIANPDTRFLASSLRLLGEIEELGGDEAAALRAFREALAINPKIGVAKKASALSRRLGI